MRYIIDAPSGLYKIDGTLRVPVKVGEGDLCWYNTYLKAESYTEPDRKAIEDEVWELADFMCRMGVQERDLCFGFSLTTEVTANLSCQEAKSKFEAWLKQKDEIHVGDEVLPSDTEFDTMIVTRVWKDDYDSACVDTIGYDGRIYSFLKKRVLKTGRHFDEVGQLLEKMRKEE